MSQLIPRPYHVKDLSGGITDNLLPGLSNSGQSYDNILINNNRDAITRQGSIIFDPVDSRFPTGDKRVSALINFNDDEEIFGIVERKLFHRDPNFTELTGPTGNPVFGVGTESQVVSQTQWQKHLFLTNDEGTNVMKVYKDDGGVLRVRNAGLPEIPFADSFVEATLQSAAETLANDLQTKLVAHMDDEGGAVGTTAHDSLDSGRGALNGTAVASDLATLLTLTIALVTGYKNHVVDGRRSATDTAAFHHRFSLETGINADLDSEKDPTKLFEAVTRLKDLHQKITWHAWAFNTHDSDIGGARVGTNLPAALSATIVDAVEEGPRILPNLADAITLANDTRTRQNDHVDWTPAGPSDHYSPGNDAEFRHNIVVPVSTDETSLINLIFHLQHQVGTHIKDAEGATTVSIGGATVALGAGRPNITPIASEPTIGDFVHGPVYGSVSPTWTLSGHPKVTTSSSTPDAGTDDDANAVAGPGATLSFSKSPMHLDADPSPGTTQIADLFATFSTLTGWVDQLILVKGKFNEHRKQVIHGSAGTALAVTDTDTILSADPEFGSFIYAFHFFNEYKVGTKTFQDNGPVFVSETFESGLPLRNDASPVNPIKTENFPTLANGSTDNYDTSVIKIKIFRTAKNGSVFFEDGSILNGTSTFDDDLHDTLGPDPLSDQPTIYTTGGIVGNDAPPKAEHVHVFNNIGYYGNVTDKDGVVTKERLLQSIPGDPDSVPETFFDDLDSEITGIGATTDRLVVTTLDSVYRIEGIFNELGQGLIQVDKIFNKSGNISKGSLVSTPSGIFFAGTDGFYLTNGFQVIKISTHFCCIIVFK